MSSCSCVLAGKTIKALSQFLEKTAARRVLHCDKTLRTADGLFGLDEVNENVEGDGCPEQICRELQETLITDFSAPAENRNVYITLSARDALSKLFYAARITAN